MKIINKLKNFLVKEEKPLSTRETDIIENAKTVNDKVEFNWANPIR